MIGPRPLFDLSYRYPSSCYVPDASTDTADLCPRCLVRNARPEPSPPPWKESRNQPRIVILTLHHFAPFEERDRSTAYVLVRSLKRDICFASLCAAADRIPHEARAVHLHCDATHLNVPIYVLVLQAVRLVAACGHVLPCHADFHRRLDAEVIGPVSYDRPWRC